MNGHSTYRAAFQSRVGSCFRSRHSLHVLFPEKLVEVRLAHHVLQKDLVPDVPEGHAELLRQSPPIVKDPMFGKLTNLSPPVRAAAAAALPEDTGNAVLQHGLLQLMVQEAGCPVL